MVIVLAAFGFLILESPRPSSLAWIYLLKYVSATLLCTAPFLWYIC